MVQKIQVSNCAELSKAFFVAGGLSRFLDLGYWSAFTELVKKTYRQKAPGDYISFGWVFEGKADIAIEIGVKPWDLAPMKILVEESGGVYNDLNGGNSIYTDKCLVTNKHLLKDVLAICANLCES